MKARAFDGGYLVRLERGEEVTETLEGFLAEKGIHAGTAAGIGGVAGAELGFYDLPARTYRRKTLSGNLELVHYGGNITLAEGRPFIHAHVVVSGPDYRPYAGHFFRAVVAVTGEFVIRPADWKVERRLEEAVGLKLMDLS